MMTVRYHGAAGVIERGKVSQVTALHFPPVKPTSELRGTNMAPNLSAVTIKAFSIGVKHMPILALVDIGGWGSMAKMEHMGEPQGLIIDFLCQGVLCFHCYKVCIDTSTRL